MRILVTGSDSYIGAVLCPMLDIKRYGVFCYDKKNNLDICDEGMMEAAIRCCDAIVHLAAASTPAFCEANPEEAQRVNVDAVAMINRLRGDKPLFYPNTNIGLGAQIKQEVYDEASPMQTSCR